MPYVELPEDEDEDDRCDYCGEGDRVPATGYWRCPVCDAEWHEED